MPIVAQPQSRAIRRCGQRDRRRLAFRLAGLRCGLADAAEIAATVADREDNVVFSCMAIMLANTVAAVHDVAEMLLADQAGAS